jgi:hypothetical protein
LVCGQHGCGSANRARRLLGLECGGMNGHRGSPLKRTIKKDNLQIETIAALSIE